MKKRRKNRRKSNSSRNNKRLSSFRRSDSANVHIRRYLNVKRFEPLAIARTLDQSNSIPFTLLRKKSSSPLFVTTQKSLRNAVESNHKSFSYRASDMPCHERVAHNDSVRRRAYFRSVARGGSVTPAHNRTHRRCS